jgi:hypothetical protein
VRRGLTEKWGLGITFFFVFDGSGTATKQNSMTYPVLRCFDLVPELNCTYKKTRREKLAQFPTCNVS